MGFIPAHGYGVIGVKPCATMGPLCSSTDAIRNGPADAIVLEGSLGEVLDSVEYQAEIANTACNFTRTPVGDRDTVQGSIQRCGNGWIFSSTSTPCAPNNCT